jgi:3-oxoacyl-[acyl-carrier-protein] synthase-1
LRRLPIYKKLDPAAGSMPILRELKDNTKVNLALSNSFGFGGTNSVLAFRAMDS